MLALLKRTPANKTVKPTPAPKPKPPPLPSPKPSTNGHATPATFPKAFTEAEAEPMQLLRARHVRALLGLDKLELRKWIACGLLTPLYRPDPHRLGRRNNEKHQRAWFALSEVQIVKAKLKPRATA